MRDVGFREVCGGAVRCEGSPTKPLSTLRRAQGERISSRKLERGTALLSPSKDEPVEAWGGVFAALIGLAASVVVGWSAAPALAVNACTDNCVQVSVGSNMGKVNDTVTLPVSFAQASTSDNQPGGPDEIAALAMTIGMPGGSGSAPLQTTSSAHMPTRSAPTPS